MISVDWAYWWSLPGPSSFVRSIVGDLRQGINVVIALPRWGPPAGLGTAVRQELGDDDLLHCWRSLDLKQEDLQDPLDILPGRFVPDIDQYSLCDGSDLACSKKFDGTLVWVSGAQGQSLKAWKTLLEKYADAVRSRPVEQRGLFCLLVEGVNPSVLPRKDIALSVRCWQGMVSELDMLAWLHHLVGRKLIENATKRRLLIRLALEIVGYDPLIAVKAADKLDLENLGNPREWLLDVAANRGWQAGMVPTWEEGACDEMEGKNRVHAAFLSLAQDAQKHIDFLLWRAQVGVLFPLLEEARREYLQKYESQLRVPHDTGQGSVIHDKEDLELGHIHYQLYGRIDRQELRRLQLLRDMRNALAHK